MRDLAAGDKLEIEVQGKGVVRVTKPRSGSEKMVLTFNKEVLEKSPELKKKLIDKGVAKEELKRTPPAVASVSIKPNV